MILYALTIFVSAFLLFQVQPIIAKMLLPWFGGSAGVWTTCLLFFQVVLLLGYVYAHWLLRSFRPRAQARIHLTLLAVSVLVLPILPKDSWKPSGPEAPMLHILGLLAVTVGLPYFLLSTTSPLLQAWYRKARAGAVPYWLFALSNAGSMLGLLSYPLIVEPRFSTHHQAIAWSVAYVGLVALCAAVALRKQEAAAIPNEAEANPEPAPGWGVRLLWIALPACASTLLFAITTHLSQNVAAIPMLWVIPLSLYLLSFILCFAGHGLYRRNPFLQLFAVALGGMAYGLLPGNINAPLILVIPLFSMGLFLCCMACHGELARLKPHPAHLTSFYLMTSLGGALGGVFVGLVAPRIFRWYLELPLALMGSAILVLITLHRDPASIFYKARWRPTWLIAIVLTVLLCVYIVVAAGLLIGLPRVMVRNFYGVLRVADTGSMLAETRRRVLMNGTINHGEQFLDPARHDLPTTYYGPRSGVGLALHEREPQSNLRVGIIGLGAGTMAAYGRPGDRYTFYEINPLVVLVAKNQFTFLKDCPAALDIVLGDARLSLERESPQAFDVLAVDAFSGDSIPVHLLTREAFTLYFHHLSRGGVLAIHVSNGYVNLLPVVQGAVESFGKRAVVIDNRENIENEMFRAIWVLISDRQELFDQIDIKVAATPLKTASKIRLWTDDYSNLLGVLAPPPPRS